MKILVTGMATSPWALIVLAGLLEIGGALGLKYAWDRGIAWRACAIAAMLLSFGCLIRALRDLPVGTAYAVWTGIGAAGVALLGIALFGESAHPARIGFIALVVIGVIGLRVTAEL